ncbi:MAG: cytochrome-c peroxidase [Candidatus Kapaibacterium sp.]
MTTPSSTTTPDQPVVTNIPKTPAPLSIPIDNPQTDAKVELGKHLFFDKALSADNSTACASCHQVSHGFSDVTSTSVGMQQQLHGTRNAPALANVAYNTAFTWDGRFKSLEEHAPGPIFNSVEMGNNFSTTPRDTVPNGYNSGPGPNDTNFLFKRLDNRGKDKAGKSYPDLFMAAWGSDAIGPDGVSLDHIAKSIACFERTIISTQSTFDAYNNGDQTAYKYNPEALHGLKLFTDVNGANCVSCHSGYNFTDQQFHDNGIGINQNSDKGRFNITNNQADVGKFKTPSLRNIALTAPYMHDGRFSTLQDVLNSYNMGGIHRTQNTDSKVKPLNLSDQDIADIIEFLKTLTDNDLAQNKANKFTNPWGN